MFGENRTRFRRPSANTTSAAHFAAGFRNFVPSFDNGYNDPPMRTCDFPLWRTTTAPSGSMNGRVGRNRVVMAFLGGRVLV